MAAQAIGNAATVQVRFVTSQAAVRVADVPIAVPIRLRRTGLSEVINHLLALGAVLQSMRVDVVPLPLVLPWLLSRDVCWCCADSPRQFEFVLEGELLRSSLGDMIDERMLSRESIFTVEYFEAMMPPTVSHSSSQPDWVGAVCALDSGSVWWPPLVVRIFAHSSRCHACRRFVTGCYDGTVHLWSGGGDHAAVYKHATGAIKSACARALHA
jgi:ribosome biogenesis protein